MTADAPPAEVSPAPAPIAEAPAAEAPAPAPIAEAPAAEAPAAEAPAVEVTEPAAPVVEPVADADAKPVVMIVDDSRTVRKLVQITLTRTGYDVMEAEDGVEALNAIAARRPDLILSDINMPKLDGYQLCKLVKKHDRTKDIPVVMLSGKDGVFDKLRGTMAGSDDFISKPFESDDLCRKVAQYLSAAAAV